MVLSYAQYDEMNARKIQNISSIVAPTSNIYVIYVLRNLIGPLNWRLISGPLNQSPNLMLLGYYICNSNYITTTICPQKRVPEFRETLCASVKFLVCIGDVHACVCLGGLSVMCVEYVRLPYNL